MPLQVPAISKDLRKLLAFGSGIGIEIGPASLEVIAARVRPSKVEVLGRLLIENYAGRPAAEWGAEYARFLKPLGMGYLSATVLLPRREVIVRQLALPGVAPKDVESAIRFQIDTLHPYGDEEVVWGSSRLAYGSVLIGIVRREVVDRYRLLFNEAGILVNSFTFSAAAVHAAVRLNGAGEGQGLRSSRPHRRRRRRGLRREPVAPRLLRRIQPPAAARRRAGAGRAPLACRRPRRSPSSKCCPARRQPGGKRSFPQRTAVRDGARRGLSPPGAVGERAAARAPPLQFPRDPHPDADSGS